MACHELPSFKLTSVALFVPANDSRIESPRHSELEITKKKQPSILE
jgi:hypothetical protein